ncbi:MAG: carbon storage regulator [Dehalococcoidia bacterium]
MLVLDRKLQEGFWIDGRIFIKVLSIGKRRVKLGIEAPENLEIVREELAPGQDNGVPKPEGTEEAQPGGPVRSARQRQ